MLLITIGTALAVKVKTTDPPFADYLVDYLHGLRIP